MYYIKRLYIFFSTLALIIFFFSTEVVKAKSFEINDIEISQPFEINFVKNEVIDLGSKACITLFNPKNKYIFTKSHVRSKSKNASFINSEIKGKVYGVINNGFVVLDE